MESEGRDRYSSYTERNKYKTTMGTSVRQERCMGLREHRCNCRDLRNDSFSEI